MIENIENHMAHTCKCGSVNFALLKSSAIECNKCGAVLDGVRWWEGGIGAQIARAIKAEDECESLRRKLQEQPTHDPLPVVNRDLVRQAVEMLEYVGGPCTTHRAEKSALIARLNSALKANPGVEGQDQYMQGIARVSPIRTQARNAIHAALTEALQAAQPVALPSEISQEATDAIAAMMKEYGYPCNPANAARAAWRAARLYTGAQPVREPCGSCNGSGRMVRDPDIGTDQECFVCNGSGIGDV